MVATRVEMEPTGRMSDKGSPPSKPALTRRHLRSLEALIDVLYPSNSPTGVSGTSVALANKVADFVAGLPPLVRRGVRLSLTVLEWLPVVLIAVPARFSSLHPEDRMRYVQKWDEHPWYPIRGIFFLCKIMTSVVYYDEEPVRAALGIRDECLRAPSGGIGG